jgi:GMP synthase (glutamine-hydrolysing)|tara:strand:+ start:19935 stop:20672 length:738 start_codon:yes stop_codon:yes gene_type:complete
MKRDKLKILLLQIRDDSKVRREELESFARYSDLSLTQFSVLNVFDQQKFSHEVLKGFDALYVGGASEANVLEPEKYKFVKYCIDLMKYASEIELPTFASCFGFQLAILAFGGKIFSKDENYEMGSIPIKLTNLAKIDKVFKGIPNNFRALSVHQQYALDLPNKLDLLAYTSDCLHSFKHRNAPFWAFQFHPEVDRDTVFTRLSIYKEKYTKNEKQFQNVLNSLVETPDSHKLMKNFVDRVLIKEN